MAIEASKADRQTAIPGIAHKLVLHDLFQAKARTLLMTHHLFDHARTDGPRIMVSNVYEHI